MPLNYTPISWKNVDPLNRDQMKVFLLQLSDFLNSAFNPAFLSFALNGQGLLNPGSMSSASNTLVGNNTGATAADAGLTVTQVLTMLSLQTAVQNFGTVTTNQSINCANSALVIAVETVNATAHTFTFQNLGNAFVFFRFSNSNAANCTLKMAGTTPTLTITSESGGAVTDMVATGIAISPGVTRIFMGASISAAANLYLGFI